MAKQRRKDSVGIEWREPPPKHARSTRYHSVRESLRARPGEWACIKKIRPGEKRQVPHAFESNCRNSPAWAGFEVVARGREVFARYVGKTKGTP